jgi:hypothetical protein
MGPPLQRVEGATGLFQLWPTWTWTTLAAGVPNPAAKLIAVSDLSDHVGDDEAALSGSRSAR